MWVVHLSAFFVRTTRGTTRVRYIRKFWDLAIAITYLATGETAYIKCLIAPGARLSADSAEFNDDHKCLFVYFN